MTITIPERLRAVLNDGLSSVAICNKNDLRAILDDRERLEKAAIAEQKYSHSLERSISDSKARISQLEAELAKALEVLEFYGYNWMAEHRVGDFHQANAELSFDGGNRARAYIKDTTNDQ